MKENVFVDLETEHLIFESPEEHWLVVTVAEVAALTITLIDIDSLAFGVPVLGSKEIEFMGEIAN